MRIRPLEVGTALTAFFDLQATDSAFRHTCHPQMSEIGWNAYLSFLERKKLAPFEPRENNGRAHVSFVAGPVGFNCDLAVWFAMSCFEEESPPTDSEMYVWKQLMRCFAIGHAMEEELYQWVTPALEIYYAPRGIEITRMDFEWPIFRDKPHLAGDKELLAGTADVRFEYVEKGNLRVGVVDFKSTSVGRADKRSRTTGIEAEAEYVRQVSTYLEPIEADWGALVYWIKQWDHGFQQAEVERRPGYYQKTIRRLDGIYGDVAVARPSPATPGSHCRKCPFRGACQEVTDMHVGA